MVRVFSMMMLGAALVLSGCSTVDLSLIHISEPTRPY